jgi:hypothetical protein
MARDGMPKNWLVYQPPARQVLPHGDKIRLRPQGQLERDMWAYADHFRVLGGYFYACSIYSYQGWIQNIQEMHADRPWPEPDSIAMQEY